MLNAAFLSVLAVAAASWLLGLITLLNNSKRYANQIFALLCLFCGVYPTVNFLADNDPANALFWARTTFALAAVMLACMMLFVGNFPRRIKRRLFEPVIAGVALLVVSLSYHPNFIPSVVLKAAKTDVQTGALYPLFLVYVVVCISAAAVVVHQSLRRSSGSDKIRVRYLVLGLFLTAGLTSTTNLLLPLVLGNNDLSVLGSYFILVFIGLSTYAIVRHRLFDIRSLVVRSLVFVLVLGALTLMYSLVVFQLGTLLFSQDTSQAVKDAYSVVAAVVLATTFQPLRQFVEHLTEKIFYRHHYHSQVVLGRLSKILTSEIELTHLMRLSIAELCRSLNIQFGQIVVLHHDRVFRVEHYGIVPERLMVLPQLKRLDKSLLVADELPEGERRAIMEHHGIRVSALLRTHNEVTGYLLAGDKLSGDIYSAQDLDVISIAAKELAVAVQNAKAYAEIEAFNITLQQRVEHATNRLRVANRHLKELDSAKDEFISMASHQLRTPLTTIKGYLSMMLEGDAGKLTKDQKQFVDYAFGASERMVNLISDLLNVSRLSAGRFLIQTKPTDIIAMASDEVRQLQSHATAKNIELRLEAPTTSLPLVELDENKTRQVVMNFIDNAIYYTQAGSVIVQLKRVGDNIRLEVRDSGIGVPDEAKKKLFSKFYRAENAQGVRPDGTGLGLYLAKRVVEDQGGTIIFSSTEGKGSTFGFELPIKAAHVKDTHGKH